MNIRVKLFAAARQFIGHEALDVDLPDEATIAQLRAEMIEQFPALADVLAHSMFALNTEFADDESLIQPNAEIACIPPVSGG